MALETGGIVNPAATEVGVGGRLANNGPRLIIGHEEPSVGSRG